MRAEVLAIAGITSSCRRLSRHSGRSSGCDDDDDDVRFPHFHGDRLRLGQAHGHSIRWCDKAPKLNPPALAAALFTR